MTSSSVLGVAECEKLLVRPGTAFETLDMVIDGRRLRVWKNAPTDFRSMIMEAMPKWASREFLSSPVADPEPLTARESLTFEETYQRALSLAALLRERGAGVGTRIAVGGPNCTGWVVAFIAVHLVGGCPVLLNNGLHVDAQVHCLTLTKPELVIVDYQLATQLGPLAKALQSKGVGAIWCWTGMEHVPSAARDGVTGLLNLTPRPESIEAVKTGVWCGSLNPESDGIIFFTSGTTSLPKGVLVTQRQALHIIISSSYSLARTGLRAGLTPEAAIAAASVPRSDGVALLSIPLFHVQGCLSWLVEAIYHGSKLVFLRRWSVPTAVDIMVKEKVGKIGGVPAICTAVLQSPLLPKEFELASTSFGGASPPSRLPKDLVMRWPYLLPATGWGMTETNGLHTSFAGSEYVNKPRACGQTIPITDIRIVDPETRKELPTGVVGLLLAKGSNVMKCYVNNPKATAETLDPEGWLDTGDMAFIDEFGDLYITDRAKDIIIRGGENVPSAEVESAVSADDRVSEACAVPVPDAVLGERVGLCVSLAPGVKLSDATPMSIAEASWKRLRYPARPDVVVVLDGPLPWNASQKVLKSEVKKIVLAEWERRGRQPLVDSRDSRARL